MLWNVCSVKWSANFYFVVSLSIRSAVYFQMGFFPFSFIPDSMEANSLWSRNCNGLELDRKKMILSDGLEVH